MTRSATTRFDADYWRERAEEAHSKADDMRTAECRRSLLTIAESYHAMAERADRQAEGEARLEAQRRAFRARWSQ